MATAKHTRPRRARTAPKSVPTASDPRLADLRARVQALGYELLDDAAADPAFGDAEADRRYYVLDPKARKLVAWLPNTIDGVNDWCDQREADAGAAPTPDDKDAAVTDPDRRPFPELVTSLQSHLYGIEALADMLYQINPAEIDFDALVPVLKRECTGAIHAVDELEFIKVASREGGAS